MTEKRPPLPISVTRDTAIPVEKDYFDGRENQAELSAAFWTGGGILFPTLAAHFSTMFGLQFDGEATARDLRNLLNLQGIDPEAILESFMAKYAANPISADLESLDTVPRPTFVSEQAGSGLMRIGFASLTNAVYATLLAVGNKIGSRSIRKKFEAQNPAPSPATEFAVHEHKIQLREGIGEFLAGQSGYIYGIRRMDAGYEQEHLGEYIHLIIESLRERMADRGDDPDFVGLLLPADFAQQFSRTTPGYTAAQVRDVLVGKRYEVEQAAADEQVILFNREQMEDIQLSISEHVLDVLQNLKDKRPLQLYMAVLASDSESKEAAIDEFRRSYGSMFSSKLVAQFSGSEAAKNRYDTKRPPSARELESGVTTPKTTESFRQAAISWDRTIGARAASPNLPEHFEIDLNSPTAAQDLAAAQREYGLQQLANKKNKVLSAANLQTQNRSDADRTEATLRETFVPAAIQRKMKENGIKDDVVNLDLYDYARTLTGPERELTLMYYLDGLLRNNLAYETGVDPRVLYELIKSDTVTFGNYSKFGESRRKFWKRLLSWRAMGALTISLSFSAASFQPSVEQATRDVVQQVVLTAENAIDSLDTDRRIRSDFLRAVERAGLTDYMAAEYDPEDVDREQLARIAELAASSGINYLGSNDGSVNSVSMEGPGIPEDPSRAIRAEIISERGGATAEGYYIESTFVVETLANGVMQGVALTPEQEGAAEIEAPPINMSTADPFLVLRLLRSTNPAEESRYKLPIKAGHAVTGVRLSSVGNADIPGIGISESDATAPDYSLHLLPDGTYLLKVQPTGNREVIAISYQLTESEDPDRVPHSYVPEALHDMPQIAIDDPQLIASLFELTGDFADSPADFVQAVRQDCLYQLGTSSFSRPQDIVRQVAQRGTGDCDTCNSGTILMYNYQEPNKEEWMTLAVGSINSGTLAGGGSSTLPGVTDGKGNLLTTLEQHGFTLLGSQVYDATSGIVADATTAQLLAEKAAVDFSGAAEQMMQRETVYEESGRVSRSILNSTLAATGLTMSTLLGGLALNSLRGKEFIGAERVRRVRKRFATTRENLRRRVGYLALRRKHGYQPEDQVDHRLHRAGSLLTALSHMNSEGDVFDIAVTADVVRAEQRQSEMTVREFLQFLQTNTTHALRLEFVQQSRKLLRTDAISSSWQGLTKDDVKLASSLCKIVNSISTSAGG